MFVSSIQVICSIPASSKASVNIAVSQNGVQLSNSFVLQMVDPVSFAAVSPNWGSSSSNSVVTLIGRGFQSSMMVYFGRMLALSATFLSESRMVIICAHNYCNYFVLEELRNKTEARYSQETGQRSNNKQYKKCLYRHNCKIKRNNRSNEA